MAQLNTPVSPLRLHAADALRRARKLPIGHARNDLRQLAVGLIWLDRRGAPSTIEHQLNALHQAQAGKSDRNAAP